MSCLDHHADAFRLKHLMNGIGDLRSHPLLNLQPFGIDLNNACQFGYSHHSMSWDVANPGAADDRCHVVFAMALEGNTAKDDQIGLSRRPSLSELERIHVRLLSQLKH